MAPLRGNPAGAVPTSTRISALADFNRDGLPDVATVSQSPAHGFMNVVNVAVTDGSGAPKLVASYTLDQVNDAVALRAADWNRDGKLDLALIATAQDVNQPSWVLVVLLGNGDGTFAAPSYYPLGTAQAADAVVADFNKDGIADIAIAESGGFMSVLLGNGDGTFKSPVKFFDGGGAHLVAADFNGDGNVDIAASQYSTYSAASNAQTALLFGNGDGTFSSATFLPATFAAGFAADLNNDGKADLIGRTGSSMQVLLGKGDGTFNALPAISTQDATPLGVSDLNGDGKLDLIYLLYGYKVIETDVAAGNGDGTFASGLSVATSVENDGGASFLQVADMNRDGKPDLLMIEQIRAFPPGVFVLLNTSQPPPPPALGLAAGQPSSQTINAGATATYSFSIGGKGFAGQVSLSCTGAPTAATCSFPGGSTVNVNGAAASAFSVMVSTTARTASSLGNGSLPFGSLFTFAILGCALVPWSFDPRAWRKLVALLALAIVVLCCSCGGPGGAGSNPPPPPTGSPAGTYTITVSATGGSLTEGTTVKLTIQ